MTRQKTQPTLDQLKDMPLGLLRAEIAQLCVDAAISDHAEVLADAEMLAMDPDPQPERIVELWNMLRGVSGGNPEEVCYCGDRRRDHLENGPCNLNGLGHGTITGDGWDDKCLKFR